MLRSLASPLLALTATAWIGACGPSPRDAPADPRSLFDEAERLLRAYRKDASENAIIAYRNARDIWNGEGDFANAAMASRGIGTAQEQLGHLDAALKSYLEAESFCQESCDSLLTSRIVSRIGFVKARLAGDEASQREAFRECQRALSVARQAKGRQEEAEALSCAGEAEYVRGNLEEAARLYREAGAIWESLGNPRGRARAMLDEGAVQSDLSRFDEAKENLEGALSLSAPSGDLRGVALALTALGHLELRRGEYQIAINYFRQALDRLEPSGDLVWQAATYGGLGSIYLEMGDGERARAHLEAAVERSRETGLVAATWDVLLALGRVHLSLGAPREALKRFQEALELAERTESDHWKQAYSLQQKSLALQAIDDPDDSLRALERALTLQESTQDRRLEAAIRMELGNTLALLGDPSRAMESFQQALELNRAAGNRVGEATTLFGMARAADGRADPLLAKTYIERALDVAESLRAEVESRELRASYFASVFSFHELYIDILMELDDRDPGENFAVAAFGASERARARSLLESLIETGVDIKTGVDPVLLSREADLRRRLDETVARRLRSAKGEAGDVHALDTEIEDLAASHDLLLAEIRSTSPRYSALIRRDPLTLEQVQTELLDDDTVLLEYALGDARSFLWAVSKERFESFELAPRSDIEASVARLYELVTARARDVSESLQDRNRRLQKADASYWKESARLSKQLLGPVADRVEGKTVVIVPDGALQHLPFGALPDPSSANRAEAMPMIAAHEIVNLPSASALAVLRQESLGRKKPNGALAVFADPVFSSDDPRLTDVSARVSDSTEQDEVGVSRLVGSRREAAAILALAPEDATFRAIDFDASRDVVTSELVGQYRILHFATHGISNTDVPAMSGILLSMFDRDGRPRDGFLRLHDIYDLDLSAELVVLSACNTALGKQIRGEGTVGIVRAFIYAGARRAVASLWKVDDEATGELMSRFYRGMFEEELSPSAALRSAQLAMWRESEWHSPFFWGAFVLQGEWR